MMFASMALACVRAPVRTLLVLRTLPRGAGRTVPTAGISPPLKQTRSEYLNLVPLEHLDHASLAGG